jgi:hypothetical protein
MIGSSTNPRPYLVTLRRPTDDEIVTLHVMAYDALEAMLTATTRAMRTHGTGLTVDDVVPDEQTLNERRALEFTATLAHAVLGSRRRKGKEPAA